MKTKRNTMTNTSLIIIVTLYLLLLNGCGKKNEIDPQIEKETETIKSTEVAQEKKYIDPPKGLTKNIEEGEFEKFNSYASENGLAGTMVFLNGHFDGVYESTAGEYIAFHTFFEDEKGNQWLTILDTDAFTKKDYYENAIGHDVVLIANYQGYSDVAEMPSLYAKELFDKETGSLISSELYYFSHFEERYLDGTVKKNDSTMAATGSSPEQSEEPVKEEKGIDTGSSVDEVTDANDIIENTKKTEDEVSNDVIRQEVKDALQSYEDFVDEYCAFMKKYSNNDGSDLELLLDYTRFTEKMLKMSNEMEKLEGELTDAETDYYAKVMMRCSQKLLTAAQ